MAQDVRTKKSSKGFIIRGIIYFLMIILFSALLVVFTTTDLNSKLYYAAIPESQEVSIGEDETLTVYSEIKEETDEYGDTNTNIYYYYFSTNENGEEERIEIPNGMYPHEDGHETRVSVSFLGYAVAARIIAKAVMILGIVVFTLLLIILCIKIYRFATGLDELSAMKKQEKKAKKAAKKEAKKEENA
ncbi:MAG: hypothetical protein IJ168_04215 [Eubacterium sp.]|nr:hypothetical protein [Eubacterium sp.]